MKTASGLGFEEFVDGHGYLSWLGVEFDEVAEGRVVMRVPHDEKLMNPDTEDSGASVHGGIAATLVDTSSAFALRTTFDDPSRVALTTTDLDVKYLRPATSDLVAEAEVVRAGGSMGVTDVTVRSEYEGEMVDVAVGATSYRLFR